MAQRFADPFETALAEADALLQTPALAPPAAVAPDPFEATLADVDQLLQAPSLGRPLRPTLSRPARVAGITDPASARVRRPFPRGGHAAGITDPASLRVTPAPPPLALSALARPRPLTPESVRPAVSHAPSATVSVPSVPDQTFDDKIRLLQDEMAAAGFPVTLTSRVRTQEQQRQLFRQGRGSSGRIVTEKSGEAGDESKHQLGQAADFAFVGANGQPSFEEQHPWALLGEKAKALGLVWGGDWTSPVDRPHVEMPTPRPMPITAEQMRPTRTGAPPPVAARPAVAPAPEPGLFETFVRQTAGGLVGWPAEAVAATGVGVGLFAPAVLKNVQAANAAAFAPAVQASVLDDPKGTLGNPLWWAQAGGQVLGSVAGLASAAAVGGAPVALLGEAWLEGGAAYSDAVKAGASPEDAGKAAVATTLANAPWIFATNLPLFTPQTKRAILNGLVRMVSEGSQEAGQEVIRDVAAQQTFDPDRPWVGKGTVDAAIIGGVVGPLAGVAIDRLGRAASPVAARPSPPIAPVPSHGPVAEAPLPPAPRVATPAPVAAADPELDQAVGRTLDQAVAGADQVLMELSQEERNAAARVEQAADVPVTRDIAAIESGRALERRIAAGVSPTGEERRAPIVVAPAEPPAAPAREPGPRYVLPSFVTAQYRKPPVAATQEVRDEEPIAPAPVAPSSVSGPAAASIDFDVRSLQTGERSTLTVPADRPAPPVAAPPTLHRQAYDTLQRMDRWPMNPVELRARVAAEAGVTPDAFVNDIDALNDAVEAALNQRHRAALDPAATLGGRIKGALASEAQLPRAHRTLEKSKLQQFSTPLPIAEAATAAAQLAQGDAVLEPTAGTGNLLAPIDKPGVTVHAIELSGRRADLLDAQGYPVQRGDYLATKPSTTPTVIITNPPWGKYTTQKYGSPVGLDFMPGDVAERFVAKNLRDLAPGGRLVAVMPTTMLGEGSEFRRWLRQQHTVRAIIKSPPNAYRTRATDVESVLLVVDKVPPAEKVLPATIATASWEEYARAVEAISARSSGRTSAGDQPAVAVSAAPSAAGAGPARDAAAGAVPGVQPAGAGGAGRAGAEGRGVPGAGFGAAAESVGSDAREPTAEGRPAKAPVPVAGRGAERLPERPRSELAEPGRDVAVGTGRDAELVAPRAAGRVDEPTGTRTGPGLSRERLEEPGPAPGGAPAEPAGEFADVVDHTQDDRRSAAGSRQFAPYLRRTALRGVGHPKLIVEARQLAGVAYPPLTLRPGRAITTALAQRRVSVEQAEQALAALQANLQGHHGYLAADNVGVGKSREIALVILDLMDRAKADGRELRLVVTTKSADNIRDLVDQELYYVARGRTRDGRDLMDDAAPKVVPEALDFEIVRTQEWPDAKRTGQEYKPLPKHARAIYVTDFYNLSAFRQALVDVTPHGIIGDEAHRFKNVEGAAAGGAWQNLHATIMRGVDRAQQVFAYFTATPAQTIYDYQYLYGLRLWPIDGFADWVNLVTGQSNEAQATALAEATERGAKKLDALADAAGTAVVGGDAEDVARTDRPRFGPRAGSDVFAAKLTPAEAEQIPREWKMQGRFSARDLWREGQEFVIHEVTLPAAHADKYDQFVALAQDIAKKAYRFGLLDATGKSSRFGVTGQLQFAAKRIQMQPALEEAIRLAKAKVAEGHQVVLSVINVSEMDPEAGNIAAAIQKINTRIREVDPDDPDGGVIDQGEIPEALVAQAELLEQAKALGKFADPVEMVSEAFGADNVAFIIGDSGAARQVAMREFQQGKRSVAFLSQAGSTGINLDHRVFTTGGARGRRVFIDVQYEWSATESIQRYGRVGRSASLTQPVLMPLTFGNASEKKFLATIANRMSALGALSKGGADTTGAGGLEEFEIFGPDANFAARRAYEDLDRDEKRQFAVVKSVFRSPNRSAEDPFEPIDVGPSASSVRDYQLALLFVPLRTSNKFWSAFVRHRASVRELMGHQTQSRTEAFTGEILRTTPLKDDLTLTEVKNQKGHRFGVLSGIITPRMPLLRDFLYSESETGERTFQRRYVTFSAGSHIVSGLQIPWGQVKRVAEAFGHDLAGDVLDSPAKVEAALKAGEVVRLQHRSEGAPAPWRLRMRKDGKIAIEGAQMADRTLLLHNAGAYSPVGTFWFIAEGEGKFEQFLERFPVEQPAPKKAAPPVKAKGEAPLGMPALTPRPPAAVTRGAPLPVGEKQLPRSAIIQRLSEGLLVPIATGGFRGRLRAIYKPHPRVIRTRVANDVEAIAHELGHHVHETLALSVAPRDRLFEVELQTLGRATSRPSFSARRQRQEGQAEFLRLYLTDPAAAEREAPIYFEAWEAALDRQPALAQVLRTAQRQLQGYLALDPVDRIKAHINFTGRSERPRGTLAQRAQVEWIEELMPLRAAVRALAAAHPVEAHENAEVLADLAAGATAKAQGFLEAGVRDRDQTLIAASPLPALRPFVAEMDNVAAYLVAQRVVTDLAPRGIVTGVALADAQATVTRFEARYAAAAKALYAFKDGLLEYAHREGVLSDRQVQRIRRLNRAHVSFRRVLDAVRAVGDGAKRVANRTVPIKRIKGSGLEIVNPLESLVRDTFALVDMVEKNRVMQMFDRHAQAVPGGGRYLEAVPVPQQRTVFNLAQVEDAIRAELDAAGVETPDDLDFQQLVQVFTPQQFARGDQGYLTFIQDGQRQWRRTHDLALYDALTAVGQRAPELVVALLMRPARFLRAMATGTPTFALYNFARDTFTARVYSQYGFVPVLDSLRGLFEAVKRGDLYQAFVTSGAGNATLMSGDRDRQRALLRSLGLRRGELRERLADAVNTPFEWVRAIGDAVEHAPRLREFQRALDVEGRTPAGYAKAAAAARNLTQDFSKGGRSSKAWNRYTAFFNANLYGKVRLAEVFQRDPLGATWRALTSVTLLSVLLWSLNHDDDEYAELPEWERENFWHVPLGVGPGHGWVKVRKPFDLGLVFGTLFEAALDFLDTQDPQALQTLLPAREDALAAVVALTPTAILPMVEVAANYDTFRGRAIVNPFDLDLEPELQYTRWTSETAKIIGRVLDVSPAKVDHLLYGYGAGVVRGVVSSTERAGDALGLGPRTKPAAGAGGWPLVGAVYRRGLSESAAAVDRFFRDRDALSGTTESLQRFQRAGQLAEAQALAAERRDLLARGPILRNADRALRDLRQQINAVFATTAMTPAAKRAALDRLYERMVDIARQAAGDPPIYAGRAAVPVGGR